ncbi:hypothetical protein [Pedobacter helvus]|uniref:Uncharacterized protein n=1 Tax=Pedobacter helvus TaxID=2563444 RepID=A0ABW9JMQ7_9SPHI|nr:hypothetical protein [Pedobacter ureilyticus]
MIPIVEEISSVTKNGVKKTTAASLKRYRTVGSLPGLTQETLTLPKLSASFTPAYLEDLGNGKMLKSDPNYITIANVLQYDERGNAVVLGDGKKGVKSFLYNEKRKNIIAEITNAKLSEIVFSDFEDQNERAFEGDYVLDNAYDNNQLIGKKALFGYSGVPFKKTVDKGLGKYYRLTFHGNTVEYTGHYLHIKLMDGVQTININLATDPNLGVWKFYEKLIDVSALGNTFEIEITPSDDMILDDIAFYPAMANIKSYTYETPFGKKSELDSRGGITLYEYDDLGRLKFVKDQNKNILKHVEYRFNNDLPIEFNANFNEKLLSNVEGYMDVAPGKVNVGDAWSFQKKDNCFTELTHQWFVNGVLQSTWGAFTYHFSQAGVYTIKHIVTHPVYGTKTEEIIKEARLIPLQINMKTEGGHQLTWCDLINNRVTKTFTVDITSGHAHGSPTYQWSAGKAYQTATPFQILSGGGINDNYITIRYPYHYNVGCKVTSLGRQTTKTISISYSSQDCEELEQ